MRKLLIAVFLVAACGKGSSGGGRKAEEPAETVAARPSPAPSLVAGALGGETTGGLAALLDVGARVNRAVVAWRSGQDAATVLAPIGFVGDEGVRAELEHAGAAHITHLGLELELLFFHNGRGRYYVRTLVHAGPEGVSFLRVDGRPQADGILKVRGEPFDAWTGAGEPFAAAGRALLERLRGPECATLPMTELSRLRALIPNDDDRSVMERELANSRARVPATCAGMADAARTDVQLRIDDHIFLVRSGDGTALGIIRGNFKHAQDGSVVLSLGRYRPFASQSSRQP